MRIQSKDLLFGQPVLKIRAILRYAMNNYLIGNNRGELVDKISLLIVQPVSVARNILSAILQDDLIILTINKSSFRYKYEVSATDKGRRLGIAKANPPISRPKADELLKELLERVAEINSNKLLAYKVQTIRIFGSYLSGKDILGDLDIAFKLVPNGNANDVENKCLQRIRLALDNGRYFSRFFDQIYWPQQEVINLLKTKKKGLSLHDENDDPVIHKTTHVTVFQFEE